MIAAMHDIAASDGRVLDVLRGGASAGPALVLHHGTPADASLWLDWHATALAAGLQLLSLSRPGYASATRVPERRVRDVAVDVGAMLDRFAVPWFVTAGWSGGGPHALACAHAFPERCRAAATLAGVAPFGEPGLDWLAGMGPENVAEFGAALQGEATLRAWLAANGEAVRHATGPELAAAFGGLIPEVDRAALTLGFADRMAAQTRRALAPGFDGWIDDDLAFAAPWGFAPAEIAVPVTVWQGDLDLMVPAAHGRWLAAHLPTARARPAPGHGHISLVTTYRDAVVADLLARASRSEPARA